MERMRKSLSGAWCPAALLVVVFFSGLAAVGAEENDSVGPTGHAEQIHRVSSREDPPDQGMTGEGLTAEMLVAGNVGTESMFGTDGTYSEYGLSLHYDSPDSAFFGSADFRALGDDRYGVSHAFLDSPVYFLIREAGIGFAGEPLSARAGRFPHRDVVDSPYALFVSSREHPAFLYELDYEGEWLRFLTRSVELSRNSVLDYPDKSLVFQTVAVTRPNWEFGFQDATVAVPIRAEQIEDVYAEDGDGSEEVVVERIRRSDGSGPVFVPELFFSPLPGYLTQYIIGAQEPEEGRPWGQEINYKSLMGFYGVLDGHARGTPWEVEAQILVDDFNANAVFNPDDSQNPFMGAWMLSGLIETDYGRFRLSHAGSLMYTFQTSQDRRYSYTYYPDTKFPRNGRMQTIDYRDNYFGLYLGENTLAFRLDWDDQYAAPERLGNNIDLNATVEYTASGSKSPANQWGDFDSWRDLEGAGSGTGAFSSTRLLDESPLEHGLSFSLGAALSRPLGAGALTLGLTGDFGAWFNVLERDTADDGGMDLYRPSDSTYVESRVGAFARVAFDW